MHFSFRIGFEIHSLVIFITGLPCFLKIRQIFYLSDIYPYHLLQLKILQQNVIFEQKIVLCHSVLRCWGVVNSLIFSLDIETLVNIQEERKIQSG